MPAMREFIDVLVPTMACSGKKIDPLKVHAYKQQFNWKCSAAKDFVKLAV